jgi:hypothetical protein
MTWRQPSRADELSGAIVPEGARVIGAPVAAGDVLSALVGSGASIPDAVTALLVDAAMPDAEIIAAAFGMVRNPDEMARLLSDLAATALFREDPDGLFVGMAAIGISRHSLVTGSGFELARHLHERFGLDHALWRFGFDRDDHPFDRHRGLVVEGVPKGMVFVGDLVVNQGGDDAEWFLPRSVTGVRVTGNFVPIIGARRLEEVGDLTVMGDRDGIIMIDGCPELVSVASPMNADWIMIRNCPKWDGIMPTRDDGGPAPEFMSDTKRMLPC